MATFYDGPRPVLKGRNTSQMVNPYKGTAGTYSFYPLFSTSHVLDGAPDNHHVPGTGYHPGNVLLSQLFNGTNLYVHPLSGTFPDGKATYDGARFKPLEYKGLSTAKAFSTGYGHAVDRASDYALYSNYKFDGVTSANVFASGFGHAQRTDAQGAAASFGLFIPDEKHGVPSAIVFTSGYGQANTTGDYGREKINEWVGVPSAKAL
jgi:hypothetical protein